MNDYLGETKIDVSTHPLTKDNSYYKFDVGDITCADMYKCSAGMYRFRKEY